MKTKIIYVLVSNENDCYLEQALVSIYSLRLYNPDANLLLLVDEETSRTLENGIRKLILNYVSKLVIVDVPFHYSKQQKSRYIKTSLRSQVIGDFLFIDCDTIINEELKDIDNLSCEIAAVPDCHLSIKYSWMKTNIKKWSSVLGWKYSENDFYFRFSSVRLNRLRNKLLANYLKSGGNELATVRISAFCVAMLSNNSFICKYSIFFRKYELSAAVL